MSRRYNCRCGKKRYRDEETALAAAAEHSAARDDAAENGTAEDRAEHGATVTPYRCPGGLAWHLTSRGYLPEALRTVGRRLAHELLAHDEVNLAGFQEQIIRQPRKWRRVEESAAAMVAAGIAASPAPGVVRGVDHAALRRVVQVGLDAHLQERMKRT